jgi:hypothetical protein
MRSRSILQAPPYMIAEVTNDPRFTDDDSSAHPAQQAAVWLAAYVLWLDTEPIQAAPPT